uniref:SMAUG/ZCCHC2-like PHAT domain-containing protein n=1 Tax=Periophthalmus magnuspinnatus TaxID=409849 RepID=A0A3B4B5P5_9GOBI
MMFRDQVSVLAGWFKGWNECEQTVALLSLLKRVSRTQARFLQLCLEHSLSECSELIAAETDANDPVVISQWHSESKERAISLVLSHLPLLKPGNSQAKGEYMRLLPWILAQTIESGRHVEESRQLLSYALIHPATSIEDRSALALWLTHLEEHAGRGDSSGGGQKSHQPYPRYGSEDRLNGWQQQGMQWSSENGHLFPSSSVPAAINAVGTGPAGALSPAPQHSPLKRSVSLTPPICSSQPTGGALGQVWLSQEDLRRPPEHVPLSPQSSVVLYYTKLTLLNLKFLWWCFLFQKVTKGARHKIVISIQKLKERQSQLRSLEKVRDTVLEGAILRGPLQELHQMILTPIRPFTCDTSPAPGAHLSHLSGGGASGGEGESGSSSIAEGDLPAQFTRVMGKVCTQLLVSRADEENLSLYLQLLDKCLLHEAFTETQKKRLVSWKQQVQKLFRSIPRKTLLDLSAYRRSARGFGQSNSLPSGSLGAGPSVRRGLRQYQMPSRSLPGARLGLLPSTGALLGATARSSTPTGRQGLWFANPGGSNSVPSRSHSSVTRTRSLPVPQSMHLLQHPDLQQTPMEPDINNRLESLCLSMTEHALGDGADRTSTI